MTHAEYYIAVNADNDWQAELDAQGIDRYSPAARGVEGSTLRRLYEAKLAADEAMHEAVSKPEYLQAPVSVNGRLSAKN